MRIPGFSILMAIREWLNANDAFNVSNSLLHFIFFIQYFTFPQGRFQVSSFRLEFQIFKLLSGNISFQQRIKGLSIDHAGAHALQVV
ncbi:hypothetical protein GGU45_000378 [Niabella hirudinis]